MLGLKREDDSFDVFFKEMTFFFFNFFFWPCPATCGILVPQPGIEPRGSAMRGQSPNHWTTREFPFSGLFLR